MEATFGTLYVTTAECLYHWLLHILNILGQENGSHILYNMCYYSRMPVSLVTIHSGVHTQRGPCFNFFWGGEGGIVTCDLL